MPHSAQCSPRSPLDFDDRAPPVLPAKKAWKNPSASSSKEKTTHKKDPSESS